MIMQDDNLPPKSCTWLKYSLRQFDRWPRLGAIGFRNAHLYWPETINDEKFKQAYVAGGGDAKDGLWGRCRYGARYTDINMWRRVLEALAAPNSHAFCFNCPVAVPPRALLQGAPRRNPVVMSPRTLLARRLRARTAGTRAFRSSSHPSSTLHRRGPIPAAAIRASKGGGR